MPYDPDGTEAEIKDNSFSIRLRPIIIIFIQTTNILYFSKFNLFILTNSFYYNLIISEVQHSINISIEMCFEKNNRELRENLEKTFGKFCIHKIRKISECQHKKVPMNITISEA